MKAIIIAAGMGSRLEHHTSERPKCMVNVGGKSILDHQLHAFRTHNIHDFHVIRGYLADRLVLPNQANEQVHYYLNADYRHNNILFSLMCADEALTGPLLTTYSDIVYTPEVVEAVVNSPHDIALVIDRRWADAYEGRHDHPVEQAELAECDGENVLRVGKQVGPENAIGEFIGLAKFSEAGTKLLVDTWKDVRAKLGDDEPFHAAKMFRKAYMIDIFLEIIARGHKIGAVLIDGGWREIDTVEDLARVSESGWT